MKTIFVVLALVIASLAADDAPVINGHHMGETLVEMLAVNGQGKPYLEYCSYICDRAAKSASREKGSKKTSPLSEVDQLVTLPSCMRVANVLRTGAGVVETNDVKSPKPLDAEFSDGKLVRLDVDFGGYDTALMDFQAKFGVPEREWVDTYQNGIGAKFSYRRASWTVERTTISLFESKDQFSSAIFENSEYLTKKASREAAEHKNVLD